MNQALITLDDFEAAARPRISAGAYEYVASGAGDEHTLRANRQAFQAWEVLPRVLRDVSQIDTCITLFDKTHSLPLLLAPTGYHRLVHPDGELATMRGASLADCTLIASSFATVAFADVQANGTRPQWFQLYVQQDRGFTRELLARVLAAGCEAVCVTVDLPVNPMRDREARIGFDLPPGLERVNLRGLGDAMAQAPRAAQSGSVYNAVRAANVTWRDIEWLRHECSVPLLLKGVLRVEDARTAQGCGCDGLIVSNHGGRSLDGVPATIDVLPPIVDAVGADLTILLDGGIRRGTDILKALALGAKAVLVGRPYLYGLAVDGAAGVERVLSILRRELESAMGLVGAARVSEIDRSLLRSRH